MLDIAGGRGALAEALAVRGIPATVVDPWLRPDRKLPAGAEGVGAAGAGGAPRPAGWEQLCELFDEGFGARHPARLAGCAVLVGLHPDQPTGAIAAAALG